MARILVGYDGSPASRRALDHAAKRARASGDEVVVITVIPPQVRGSTLGKLVPAGLELPPDLTRTFEENAHLRLDDVARDLASSGVKITPMVRAGESAKEFLAAAKELDVAEIVIGHKAFEGPQLTLGSNADAILRGAKVPVTVVP